LVKGLPASPLRRHGRNGRDRRREECSMGKIQVNDPIRPRELITIQGERITIPVPEFRTHLSVPSICGPRGLQFTSAV